MGREHSGKHSAKKRKSGVQQLFVVTATFLLGYITANVFDVGTITDWVNTQLLAHQQISKTSSTPQTQKTAIVTKPKFEFYTLLTNEKNSTNHTVTNTTVNPNSAKPSVTAAVTGIQTVGANAVAVSTTQIAKAIDKKTVVPVQSDKGAYSVQVASFKSRQDAEHMKGLLTLKGFNVHVVSISDARRGNWFRVVVGPYSNRVLAQKAQFDLARNEHLKGMLTAG